MSASERARRCVAIILSLPCGRITSPRGIPQRLTQIVWVVAIAATSCVAPTAWSAVTDACPTYTYLGNLPNNNKADWSEQAQGIANDGKHWFFTHEKRLFKYDSNWREVDGNDTGKINSVGFPPEMASLGMDHFGDLDYYGGYLFVPFEDNHGVLTGFPAREVKTPPFAIIGVFRASDLAFVDWMDVTAYQGKLGWVAIDPVERVLYSSVSTLEASVRLERYQLRLESIDNDADNNEAPGSFLTPVRRPIVLVESDGQPLVGQYTYMQGGVFSPRGDLYLSVGKAGDSAAKTNGGLHLFRRSEDGRSFRRIHSSVNLNGAEAGVPQFAYEYHPQDSIFGGLGEEPEGIDWWNRDDIAGSRYSGQLHAILLDNQAGDDRIWLKHYRVDYSCATDDEVGPRTIRGAQAGAASTVSAGRQSPSPAGSSAAGRALLPPDPQVPSAGNYHVRAVTYVEAEWRGALRGIDWACAGKNCYGLNRSSSAQDLAVIPACKALAAKVAGVRAFLAEGSRSTEGGSQTLAQCNSGIRIEGEKKFYYSARLGRTFERPDRIQDSKYGIVWNCENSACWASISQMDPSWRHCQELRKKVGRILSFQQPDTRLSRSELAQCNE